jgi:hypothetical protein
MARFAAGDAPLLGRARIRAFRELAAVDGATEIAGLDAGVPWLVERSWGPGRVVVAAAGLDAASGTLAANPDFVPWLHVLALHLAGSGGGRAATRPGEPIRLEVAAEATGADPPARVVRPDGREARLVVERSGDGAWVEFREAEEPGVYEFDVPAGRGGLETVHVEVAADPRERDAAGLDTAEWARLAEGWGFERPQDAGGLTAALLGAAASGGPRPVWRWVLAAVLGGLCLEIVATRRLSRARGLAVGDES